MAALLVAGCANPFAKYYQDRTGGADLTKSRTVVFEKGGPQLRRGIDPEEDFVRMLEDGYTLVGISTFNGANGINPALAAAHGRRVHATVVLVYSKYTNTVTSIVPLALPSAESSTTNITGQLRSANGEATNFSGRAISTTYGTNTTFIPYSVDRSDYFASYWVKRVTPVFGVNVKEMSNEMRQVLGTNKGVVITAVVKGSPAFNADIMRGDIIMKIGDIDMFDPKLIIDVGKRYAGESVTVHLVRRGSELTKEIQFNTSP